MGPFMAGSTAPDAPAQPAPEAPPRQCEIGCCEAASKPESLIKPCRCCPADYCQDCLAEMFKGATIDNTRMPPRCCALLQLHTALAGLTEGEATAYRKKFEEWVTTEKTYCPSPTCSAFIPNRLLPSKEGRKEVSLQSVLSELLDQITKAPVARFFRGESNDAQFPGYSTTIKHPVDLNIMKANSESSQYRTTDDLTKDITLMVSNAEKYHGLDHPIARTARKLYAHYVDKLAAVVDELAALAADNRPRNHFLCPECRIAICVKCRQIDHGNTPCDTSAQDYELAILEQFRYKRCPLCRTAVKKMFGCSHMQCQCGAHWCYYCQRSINECDGACPEREDEEEYDEEDYDEDGEDADSLDDEPETSQPKVDASVPMTKVDTPVAVPSAASPTPAVPVVNLDAGGERRWAGGDLDFGSEPDDDGSYTQIWSCRHRFVEFHESNDDFLHGDLTKMECNKCFVAVRPTLKAAPMARNKLRKVSAKSRFDVPPLPSPKSMFDRSPKSPVGGTRTIYTAVNQAWECSSCRLVVCEGCKSGAGKDEGSG